ncbi:MAG: ADP-ribosylglycohydrolase family protein, partial [Proteobacteria bacterium]|nr:ADP-ribosylglycohydrolase family protein [Pseudomonadota bacterium]
MLLELAIGDAYGAGFEYASEMNQYNDLSRYVQHPRHKGVYPGQYTDDTQMSIAIAELIISGDEWTPLNIANRFVDCFKRDWRDGYARGFQKFLEEVKSGQDFLNKIKPHSDKSGSAMRACPIGVYSDVHEVLEKAEIQAKITHDTYDGIAAAKAAALMSHLCFHDKACYYYVVFMDNALNNYVPGYGWDTDWVGKVKSKGYMSVHAALTAVRRNTKLSDLLKDCIDFTGDTDTVATIALGAASHSSEYTNDLPQVLIDTLENGKFG